MKKKSSTLTLRLNKEENKILDELKKSTGEKTGTAALMRAAVLYPEMKDQIRRLSKELSDSATECEAITYEINKVRNEFKSIKKFFDSK